MRSVYGGDLKPSFYAKDYGDIIERGEKPETAIKLKSNIKTSDKHSYLPYGWDADRGQYIRLIPANCY